MIRGGFLTAEERQDLTELARDGLAEHRLARRANALVLLDRGMSCEEVGRVLLIDDTTIRTWHDLFETDGVDGLAGFNYGGRASRLSLEQQEKLKAWVGETLPRTTRSVDRAGVRDPADLPEVRRWQPHRHPEGQDRLRPGPGRLAAWL